MTMRLICLLLYLFTTSAIAEESRPNILFIVCDDLNTHVSCSGYEFIETPTLAELAAQSMNMPHAYCQYPVCGPSRASFLHGLYPESTGVLNNTDDIRETRPGTLSLPQFFKQHGYWTGSVGKVFHSPRHEHGEAAWHENHRFDNDELPVVATARQQFEQTHGAVELPKNRRPWKQLSKSVAAALNAQTPPGHGPSGLQDAQHKDGKNVRQVMRWLANQPFGDRPFFIALGIQKPHVPFLAPAKYFDLYPTSSIRYGATPVDLWNRVPRDAISNRYSAFGFELGVENPTLRREYMQAYHACISFLDKQLGLVLSSLKDQGFWDNTIIVFTSDHGYHLGDHFLWGKVTLFDVGTRVPLLIRVPGLTRAGSQSTAMVELIDLFPTLADLADLTAPPDLQGMSLRPVLQSPEDVGNSQAAYTVVSRGKSLGYAIRNQQWRYTQWPGGEELYNLQRDPDELNNLASSDAQAEQLAYWRLQLAERRASAGLRRQPNTNE